MTKPAEIVRQAYAALAERDFDTMSELAVAEFEMDMTNRVFNPATYRGEEGLRQFLAEIGELWEFMDMKVERLVERDDEVLALLEVAIKGRGSGLTLKDRIAQRWTVRGGKLVDMRVYADQQKALAEFEAAH
jgi:ketosteroid isomerase-like protein